MHLENALIFPTEVINQLQDLEIKTKTSFNLAQGSANDTFCNTKQQACLFWSAKITKTCPVSVFDDPLALIN